MIRRSGAGDQNDVVGHVGERHERLALREGGKRPFRNAQHAESRHGQASFENVATGGLFRHIRAPSRQTLHYLAHTRSAPIHITSGSLAQRILCRDTLLLRCV